MVKLQPFPTFIGKQFLHSCFGGVFRLPQGLLLHCKGVKNAQDLQKRNERSECAASIWKVSWPTEASHIFSRSFSDVPEKRRNSLENLRSVCHWNSKQPIGQKMGFRMFQIGKIHSYNELLWMELNTVGLHVRHFAGLAVDAKVSVACRFVSTLDAWLLYGVGCEHPHLVTVGKWRFRLGSPILKNCCNPGGDC